MVLLQFLAFIFFIGSALLMAVAGVSGHYFFAVLGVIMAVFTIVILSRCEEYFNEELRQEMMAAAAKIKPYWRK